MPGNISAADRLSTTFLWLVYLSSVFALGGCVSLHRNPVAENVIESRQLSLRGLDAIQRGEWSKAEELFGRAIEVCAADELAHHRYAESLWRRGLNQDAIQYMETAVSLGGDRSPQLVRLGEMFLSTGAIDLARERAERAVTAQPKNEAAWALRGDVLGHQGDSLGAMMSYHRALSLKPDYPSVQFALCGLYLQQNRPRRALATIDSLASTLPPDAVPQEILALRGISLKRLGRHSTSVEVLTQAIQQQEPNAELLYELAESHFLDGDAASARLTLQAALTLAPTSTRALQLYERIASK
jgi:Tfp pilus assembly protein PilF